MSTTTKSNNRLSPEFALLGFLFEQPDHGYELHQRLQDVFGNIWHASQSQTYNILKRLEVQGFVSATEVEQDKLPPRQMLELTDRGKERFKKWLNQPTKSSVHAIRVEFLTRLYFTSQYDPQNTQLMIGSQIKVVENGINELRNISANLSATQVFDHLALDLRIDLLKSVIGWLTGCQQKYLGEYTGEKTV